MSRRLKRSLLVAGGLVVLAGVHALYWYWASQLLQQGLALWVADQRAAGLRIEHGAPRPGGWPLEARLVVPDPVIARDSPAPASLVPSVWEWRGGRVRLSIRLWSPWEIAVDAAGIQALRLGDGAGAFRAQGAADVLALAIPFEPGIRPQAGTLELRGLWLDSNHGRYAVATGAGRLELQHAADADTPSAAFAGEATDLDLPPEAAGALGPRVAALAVEGEVMGPLPRAAATAERLAAWRDGDGSVTVRRIMLRWGPLAVDAAATLALDEAMQPMGAATARIGGFAATIDTLVAAGALRPATGQALKVLLTVMARPPEPGAAPVVEVSATLRDRMLTVGRIPVARLPAVTWPDGAPPPVTEAAPGPAGAPAPAPAPSAAASTAAPPASVPPAPAPPPVAPPLPAR